MVRCSQPGGDAAGFTLVELSISVTIMGIVSAVTIAGMLQMTRVNDSVANRTEMHAGVRNASEFMQQEIGQAGHLSFPNVKTLTTPVVVAAGSAVTVPVTVAPDTSGMFPNQRIVVGAGMTGVAGYEEEPVRITAVNSATQVTAVFHKSHAANAPILAYGGFRDGIVPQGETNGSTASLLKLYGDLRSNGKLEYVEYSCDATTGNLSRRAVDIPDANAPAATKPSWSIEHVLLSNITANPDNTPCFTYQQKLINGQRFVINVAITLTVLTQERDPITKVFQRETKALLNVSPRNVFNVWQLVSLDLPDYSQPTPAQVAVLLP